MSMTQNTPLSSAVPKILEMQNITKTFPGVVALDNVSFEASVGEVHALVGENGAGKSTLMKILFGAYNPDKGKLLLRGHPITFHHPVEAQRAGLAIIYQELNLLPERTVAQNIFLGREVLRYGFVDHVGMAKKTKEHLDTLGVEINPRQLVKHLSVARQQQVEIAKALSQNADILVMDEPTAALSANEVQNMIALVQRLRDRGVTIIYISHRLDEVFQIADRVTVLKDGKVVTTQKVKEITKNDLVHYMVGRELEVYYPPLVEPERIGEVIVDVKNLNSRKTLHDINFQIREHEIVGIAGLEGSGRTALARALFGVSKIDGGTICINGKEVQLRSPQDAIMEGIGFLTEDRKAEGLNLIDSIARNISLPSLKNRQRGGFIRLGAERTTVEEVTQSVELQASSQQIEVQFLSGGNQQKVVLAKWLATNAKFLIFDEPTRGIDVGAKSNIYHLMRRLSDKGVAILMISSDLPEVIGMSDRVLVMSEGAIVAEFINSDLTEAKIMKAATRLEVHGRH
jgi:ribose transport system ATP-binding protein